MNVLTQKKEFGLRHETHTLLQMSILLLLLDNSMELTFPDVSLW